MGTSRPTAKPHEVCAGEGRGMQSRTRGVRTQRDTSVGRAWGRDAMPHGGARVRGKRDEIFHYGENGKGEDFRFYFLISGIRFSGVEIFSFGMVAKKSISCYSGFTCRGYFAIECS